MGDLVCIYEVFGPDQGHGSSVQPYLRLSHHYARVQLYTTEVARACCEHPGPGRYLLGGPTMNNLMTEEQPLLRSTAPTIVTHCDYAPITPGAAAVLLEMLRAVRAARDIPAPSALAA